MIWLGRRHGAAIGATVLLSALLTLPAGARQGGWQYRLDSRPPLVNLTTYVISGSRSGGSCVFDYPELVVPDGEAAITRRDVAIDTDQCSVMVEQGIPVSAPNEPSVAAGLPPGMEVVSVGTNPASTSPARVATAASMTAATTYWKTAYNHVYWTDAVGGAVAGSETDIKWHYGTGCAFAGYGVNSMYGYARTGWYALQNPWLWTTSSCSYFEASGEDGVVRNDSFCGSSSVTITFDYTRARGSSTGSLSGTHNSYRSSSCLPLFQNNTLRVTGAGKDPPQ